MIKKGDIVLHTLSKLYFRCENGKHEKWMNMNEYYILILNPNLPDTYFIKTRG